MTTPFEPSVHDRPALALIAAVALAAVVVSCFHITESDLFMHLRNGERLLESGRLERAEVYSYTTTEAVFPNHEWLSNLVMAIVWRLGGFDLLVAVKAAAAGALVLLWAAAARARGARGPAVPLALLLGLVLIRFRLYTRPEIFTLLLLPVVDLLCLRSVARPAGRVAWWIPVLCIPWANLHPGVVLAPVVVAAHGAGALPAGRLPLIAARGTPAAGRRLLLAGAACLPAMLVNPFGLHIFTPLWRIATSDAIRAAKVREWLPPGLDDFLFFYLVLAGGSALLAATLRRMALADLALWVGFALLALRSLRHIGVFAVVVAPILALGLTTAAEAVGRGSVRHAPNLHRLLAPGIRAAMVAVLVVITTAALLSPRPTIVHQDQSRHYRFGLGLDNLSAPIATVDLVERWGLPGPLYNSWGFGGYLIWRSWPRLQVFLDGRDYMYAKLIESLRRTPAEELIGSFGFRTLLIGHDDEAMLEAAAASTELSLLGFDDRAQLWVRRGASTTRPEPQPLPNLQPHDLSLAWFDRLEPAQQAAAQRGAVLAAERATDHALPWAVLGSIQRRRGEAEAAARSYARAVERDPDQASYHNNYGAILLDLHRPWRVVEAQKTHPHARRRFRGPVPSHQHARRARRIVRAILLDLHRVDAAAASFLTAARLAPDRFEGWLNLGRARLRAGDGAGAAAALEKARRVAPRRAETHYLLGLAVNDPERARKFLRRSLELDPQGPWAADARERLGVR